MWRTVPFPMAVPAPAGQLAEPRYIGLRMTADQYLALDDDGFRYNLVNGIVIMSPRPSYGHQDVASYLTLVMRRHAAERKLGKVIAEVDIRFASDLVYAPDIVFYAASRVPPKGRPIDTPPDMIVEVLSPSNRPFDLTTKREDYERFGVREYWAIDPDTLAVHCWRLEAGKFVSAPVSGESVPSAVLTGFVLDLADLRRATA